MAFVFKVSVSASSADANSVTTAGVDTTGADFLVAATSIFQTSAGALTDSKSNTWHPLTEWDSSNASNAYLSQLFWSRPTSVGSGHTFTRSASGQFPAIAVLAFSGSLASPFDAESGNWTAGSVTTMSPAAALSPASPDLIVMSLCSDAITSPTIDSGLVTPPQEYKALVGGAALTIALSYKIQTVAASIQPAYSWTGAQHAAVAIASFKAAAAARQVGSMLAMIR